MSPPFLSTSDQPPAPPGQTPESPQETAVRDRRRRLRLPALPRRGPKRAGQDRSPWRCLRYSSMRWWSVANLVSNAGTWMQLTVQNLLVLEITGSPAMTGLSLAVQAGPGLLLGLMGGTAVDAWPRKITAGVSQALLGLIAFTTAVLVASDLMNVPALMTLAAVTGVVATIDGPACALLGNDLVRTRDVPSAIALGSAVHSIGRLAGTALAGGAVVMFGMASAFAANGFSFLFVAAVIPFLRLIDRSTETRREFGTDAVPARNEAAPGPEEPGRGAKEGLRFFLRRPQLVVLAGITALSAIFGRNYTLTLAVLVTGPMAAGAGSFGTVSTALAVGGIAGALIAGLLQRPSVRLVAILAGLGALLQIGAGLTPTLLLLIVLVIPMAMAETVSDTAGATILQTDPPAHLRGRVLGIWRSLSTGWGLIGPPLVGLLMEVAGARMALVIGGVLIAGTAGAGLLTHQRRTMRRLTATGNHDNGPRAERTVERQPRKRRLPGGSLPSLGVSGPGAKAPGSGTEQRRRRVGDSETWTARRGDPAAAFTGGQAGR